MSKDKNNAAIENAEEVIERFGGIRPMAKKMDVAVTTIQGWKKRGVIPANRRDQLLQAANTYKVDISDILSGAAVKNTADVPPANQNKDQPEKSTPLPVFAQNIRAGSTAEPSAAKPAEKTASLPVTARESLEERLVKTEQKAVTKSMWITVFLILMALALVVFLLFPAGNPQEQIQESQNRLTGLESYVTKLTGEVENIKKQQSFFSTIIPEDLDQRIAGLQKQAEAARDGVSAALKKAEGISENVLAEDAGTLDQRLHKLESYVIEMTASPHMTSLFQRLNTLGATISGQQQLDQATAELNAVIDETEVSSEEYGPQEQSALNQTLEQARMKSAALAKTFEGIPQEDLKAAALLLGMTQFRHSLGRDNAPFEDDLELLTKLVGSDDPELTDALQRLAPRAEEGVLTPAGLTSEFKAIAGEAVVASLKGEDVALQDKFKARFSQLFRVEKEGELVNGTQTQITLTKAENLLQEGNIAAAMAQVKTLQGPEASVLAPWLGEAQATMDADKIRRVVENGIRAVTNGSALRALSGGKLIRDKESGISIYRPSGQF